MANDTAFLRMILTRETRRKTKNILLKPGLQLKLPLYLLTITITFAVLLWVILYKGFDGIYEFVMLQGEVGKQIGAVIKFQTQNVIVIFSTLTIAYIFITILISMVYLHKMVGPTIAFRRHIDALKSGNYDSRITLRKNDAFTEVAQELNELAEILEKSRQRDG